MYIRCKLKSCPHFVAPCESGDWFNFKCPIGEIDELGFEEITDDTTEFFCLVVGSRSFTNYNLFVQKMDMVLSKIDKRIIIVSGGAKGADALAERYAEEKGHKLYVIQADWERGANAGYERNEEMHRFIAAHPNRGCIAFWDGKSKGTTHSFELAKKIRKPAKVNPGITRKANNSYQLRIIGFLFVLTTNIILGIINLTTIIITIGHENRVIP